GRCQSDRFGLAVHSWRHCAVPAVTRSWRQSWRWLVCGFGGLGHVLPCSNCWAVEFLGVTTVQKPAREHEQNCGPQAEDTEPLSRGQLIGLGFMRLPNEVPGLRREVGVHVLSETAW